MNTNEERKKIQQIKIEKSKSVNENEKSQFHK